MRRALVCLPLGLVVAFAALTMWETLARSTIPLSIDGQVTEVAVRAEDGDQRVWFIEVDDEFVRMDEEIGARLVEGDVVRKDAWSTTLVVNGNDVPLKLSRDARGALWFAPLLVILGAALTWLQLRGSPDTQSRT